MTTNNNGSDKEKLHTLINIFPSFDAAKKDFTVNELSKKTNFNANEIYQIINDNQDLFFWITPKRLTLVINVLSAIRNAFEISNFTSIDFEVECVTTIKSFFCTKVLNSNGLRKLINIGNNKMVEYSAFVDVERKFVKIYNLYVPEENKILEENIYLNVYPNRSKANYKRELACILAENKRASQMLYEKVKGKTLGEIGDAENISRERVRKLIEKPLLLARQWVYKYEATLISNYITTDNTLSAEAILKDFPVEQWDLIKGIIHNNSNTLRMLKYEPSIDVVYKDIYNIEDVILSVKFLETDNIEQYYSKVVKSLNSKGYLFVNTSNIKKILSNRHILLPTGYYSDERITLTAVLPKIIATYYPEGIKISDEDSIRNVAKILKDKYEVSLPGTDIIRNISSKIQCICTLIGRGTYSVTTTPKLTDDLIKNIQTYITENNSRNLYFNDMYEYFEKPLKGCGIDNSYAFHGAFKNTKDFKGIATSKDYIIATCSERQTIDTLLNNIKDYLHASDEPVTFDEIKEEFPNVKSKNLIMLALTNPQIIKWNNNSYCDVSSLPVNKAIIDIFSDTLEKVTNNQYNYAGEYALYAEILKSHSSVLDLLNIEQPQQLFGIISWYLKDSYYFSSPHILKNFTGEKFTADDLASMFLAEEKGSVVNKKKLIAKMAAVCGRVSSTLLLSINRAFSNYVRISQEEYVLRSSLKLNTKLRSKLNEIIESHKKNNVSVIENNTDITALSKIEPRITAWSITDLVTYFNLPYKIISPSPTAVSPQAIFFEADMKFENKKEALTAYYGEN